MPGEWVRAAASADVAEGAAVAVEVMGHSLALYRVEGELFCTDNVCTHEYALLTDGWLEGHVIECPLHAGQFDIRDGKGLCAPVEKPVAIFSVRQDGDDVMVQLD